MGREVVEMKIPKTLHLRNSYSTVKIFKNIHKQTVLDTEFHFLVSKLEQVALPEDSHFNRCPKCSDSTLGDIKTTFFGTLNAFGGPTNFVCATHRGLSGVRLARLRKIRNEYLLRIKKCRAKYTRLEGAIASSAMIR